MPSLTDIVHDYHFSLFKGEPGTRKSTAALSYPLPQYWFSFDGKMNALGIPQKLWGIEGKDIQYDDYNDWARATAKLEQLQVNCPYKTIVIDSITSCADYMLRQVRTMKSGTTRKSGATAGKVIGGIPVNELEDFNAESSGLTELIALTKDIHKFHKIDVILIAHVIRTEMKSADQSINVSRTIVTAGKKPAAKIPAYCDETYHFGLEQDMDVSKGGRYNVITAHVGEDFARTTLPLPPRIIIGDDPLYTKYIKPAIDKIKSPTPTVNKF